ncbi:ankyrin repeat and zinc finger domain-containing protein 1 isoform X1 [Chiloscyllium plagiosum]|uniref:ankyrin repeat and zinc finger domain-containing protein 1 isoform X1 n=1 Tax=Chiloscyllium plagiosum TaxID=36176 RepID=UPI001CB801F1|nr:ankyrin repeat and zinc finger domain-containing protein 1 isoform X1 [Chiloscyllium plagiosum]
MYCSACQCNFENREDQKEHYKLDWHRFNLRRRLLAAQPVTAERFEKIAGEISSISGSESEDSHSDAELEQLRYHRIQNVLSPVDEVPPAEEKQRGRQSLRVLFQTTDGMYFSVYRCVLQCKQVLGKPENKDSLLSSLLSLNPQTVWVILMTGGGHFAGAVFRGNEAVLHKTFHRYTVRAKRGVTQGAKDGQNKTRAPKSAGASLRRYNEAALVKDVEDLLLSWSDSLQTASAIFIRAPSYNKNIFFSGKEPVLNRTDSRLRSIPFLTRRATFKEVKRVHAILSSVEIYASDSDIAAVHSPQKRVWKEKLKVVREASSSDTEECDGEAVSLADVPTSLEILEETLGTLDLKEFDMSPKKKRKRKKRKVNEKAAQIRAPDILLEDGDAEMTQSEVTGAADSGAAPFSTGEKQMKMQLQNAQVIAAGLSEQENEYYRLRNDLYTACKTGNVEHLRELLSNVLLLHNTEHGHSDHKESSNEATESTIETEQRYLQTPGQTGDSEDSEDSEVGVESRLADSLNLGPPEKQDQCPAVGVVPMPMLCEVLDESGFTLLHVAAAAGQAPVVRLLMDAGCDPAIRDKCARPAYTVSANKETRNEFRRYVADHPGRYNYTKAQISGPLTFEMEIKKSEKKRAQKMAKKQREKEQKEQKRRLEEEEIKKKTYAAMSEREKRALAAEKRFAQQVENNTTNTISRCWLCGESLLGRVPFEYLEYKFCTTHCLQEHRKQQRV